MGRATRSTNGRGDIPRPSMRARRTAPAVAVEAPLPADGQKVLVVLAHPDDPEYFCGGSVARWAGGVDLSEPAAFPMLSSSVYFILGSRTKTITKKEEHSWPGT